MYDFVKMNLIILFHILTQFFVNDIFSLILYEIIIIMFVFFQTRCKEQIINNLFIHVKKIWIQHVIKLLINIRYKESSLRKKD
jgi:hypothetical protein